jgi:hypothetical protein
LGVTLDTPKTKLTSPVATSTSSTALAVCFVRAIDLQNKNPSGACEKNKPLQRNPRKIEKNKNTLAIGAPTRTTTEEASLAKKCNPRKKANP